MFRPMTVLFAACWAAAGTQFLAADERPNVLLVLSDDQGFGDIASHGNPLIDTPVLDRLASEGARFERFFVSPVCSPTRASLLTGRYHLRTGVHDVTRGGETMRAGETTVAEIFRAAGYATGCFGKWHNGAHWPQHPNAQGFDEFVGFCGGHFNEYFDSPLEHNGRSEPTQGFIADVLTDRAMGFIQSSAGQPWFAYVAYNTPHTPWQAPDRYWEKYRRRIPDNLTTACAYAMVENLDDNVGRLLACLDRHALGDRTVVLFLTDNGANTDRYDAGMRGQKGSLHEGGSRAPLFVRYPGRIRPGTVVRPIAAHIDLLPTLAELAGIALPSDLKLDGRSLVPLLERKTEPWPERMLFTHWGGTTPQRGAVRTERWRAVREKQAWQLYDMQADPEQQRDVAERESGVTAELASAYERWFADVASAGFDPIPTELGHPERPEVVLPAHEARLQSVVGWVSDPTSVPEGSGRRPNLREGSGQRPNLRAPKQGIAYRGGQGWANDWIADWTDVQACPSWPVQVVRGGTYRAAILYACPADDVGARVRLELGDRGIERTVDAPAEGPQRPTGDRIPRKEVYERAWGRLDLGEIELEPGQGDLTLRALTCPGRQVMELKAVVLERLDGAPAEERASR